MSANLLALECIEKVFRQFEFGKKPDFNLISKILADVYFAQCCGVFFWDLDIDIESGALFRRAEEKSFVPFDKFEVAEIKPLFMQCRYDLLSSKRFFLTDFSSLPETASGFLNNNFKELLIFPLRKITEDASGCLLFGFENSCNSFADNLLKAGEIAAEMISSYLFNEETLRGTESRYQNLIELTNDIVYSADRNGQLFYINPNIEIYGYKPEEMTGRIIYSYIHPSDKEVLKDNIRKTVSEESDSLCEFRMRRSDGRYIWFEQSSKVNKDANGKNSGISAFFTTKGEHSRIYSNQSDIKGTGLGLSISESIVAKHKGEISVKSHLNSGASFKIKLPVDSGDFRQGRVRSENARKSEVIILEEDEALRDLISMLIENMGCNVYSSDNIIEGIDKIKTEKIDLIIAENMLLDSVEEEFFAILENLPADKKPEIIIIHKSRSELQGKYNIFKSFCKPFELDDLCKTVYSALGLVQK